MPPNAKTPMRQTKFEVKAVEHISTIEMCYAWWHFWIRSSFIWGTFYQSVQGDGWFFLKSWASTNHSWNSIGTFVTSGWLSRSSARYRLFLPSFCSVFFRARGAYRYVWCHGVASLSYIRVGFILRSQLLANGVGEKVDYYVDYPWVFILGSKDHLNWG